MDSALYTSAVKGLCPWLYWTKQHHNETYDKGQYTVSAMSFTNRRRRKTSRKSCKFLPIQPFSHRHRHRLQTYWCTGRSLELCTADWNIAERCEATQVICNNENTALHWTALHCAALRCTALHYVLRSIVALRSFRLKLCNVKCIVHCTASIFISAHY